MNNKIQTKFNDGQKICSIITANGEKSFCFISNNKLKLMSGRIYYIPVNSNDDSDLYTNIKIPSTLAEKIDVRSIKNNLASVIPLQHNIEIENEVNICELIKN